MLNSLRAARWRNSKFVPQLAAMLCASGLLLGLSAPAEAVITATKSGTTLTILGDPAVDDTITVTQGAGNINVAGIATPFAGIATIKIDGRGGFESVTIGPLTLLGSIEFRPREGGANLTILSSTIGGGVTVLGNTDVELEACGIAGNVKIETGDDSDFIELRTGTTVAGAVSIKTDGNQDEVGVVDSNVGTDLTIDTGDSLDTALVQNINVGRKLTIKTGDGMDSVTVTDAEVEDGDATIETGAGPATVLVDDTSKFDLDLSIKTGNDVDLVTVECDIVVNGRLSIETGAGSDVVDLNSGIFVLQGINISTGDGHDTVTLTHTENCSNVTFASLADLVIETAGGDDDITIASTVTSGGENPFVVVDGNVSIKSGDGLDMLSVTLLRWGSALLIDTGNQNDLLDCDKLNTFSALKSNILLGGGNDGVELTNSVLPTSLLTINGGSGGDIFSLSGNTFGVPPVLKNFE